ncbi:MAG: glycosyltransferase family 2 protein [Candidatus Omnitrophica bacterium]|nr:glycosyltransferase family 2 protein [Candidatus Omnitrophota bacterium]MDD5672505.1 glycosyltransferase family 2 protein [Candidatus Omnitrophota bacterium]
MICFQQLTVIIPAYNEENTIEEVVRRVSKVHLYHLKKEIIVVDDGSTDRTREILRRMKDIKTIFHESNRGKGSAIKTGLSHASGDVILVQDADLEYEPQDYPHILRPILTGDCEIVMGSRFVWIKPKLFGESADPYFFHYVCDRWITWIANWLYKREHTDYRGGYKAFTRSLANKVLLQTEGFDFDGELICKSLKKGYEVIEVPIRYHPRLYAEGKKLRFKDMLSMLATIFKCRFMPA